MKDFKKKINKRLASAKLSQTEVDVTIVCSIDIICERKKRLMKKKVFYGQGRNPLHIGPVDPSICPPACKDLFIKIKDKR